MLGENWAAKLQKKSFSATKHSVNSEKNPNHSTQYRQNYTFLTEKSAFLTLF